MGRRRGAPFGALVAAAWLGAAALVVPSNTAAAVPDAPAFLAEQQLSPETTGRPAEPAPAPSRTTWWQETPSPAPEPTPEPEPVPEPEPEPPAADCAVAACIALTFDDGPADYTWTLLDELAGKGVHATFFVLGSMAEKHPEVLTRMAAEGHVVGNHSWSHPRLTSLSVEGAGWQIDATAAVVQQATGVAPTLVRPPYGLSNDTVLAVLAERGDASILWSVDTEDWRNRDVGITTQRALAGAAPGAIILMHDIHPSTVQAVPGIVDQLQAAGYTLVTVPELLGPTDPGQVYRSR